MIALIIIGGCLIAGVIILYAFYALRDVTVCNSSTITNILILVSIFAGAGMIGWGTSGVINENNQRKKDVFIEDSDLVSVFDLDFIIHEINPNDTEEIKEYAELLKYIDESVLFYSKENKYVYKMEAGKLNPYYINDKSTVYENNNIVLK